MNWVRAFIDRPVGTTLLTIGIALFGFIAYRFLPVAPLPQIEFPTISVSASLPGASPETMAATVATPLERAIGAIAGVTEITSNSSLGSTRITVQFDLGRSIDAAARDVQAALNAAQSQLPTGMPDNPTLRKANPADAPIMILSLTSASLTRGQMYDAASTVLAQRIAQVDGIGQVTIGGGALPAVRVRVDPGRLAATGLALDDVRVALVEASANRPKGNLDDGQRSWQVGANDQARSAADFAPLILRYQDGNVLRLTDVASVSDSVQDVRTYGVSNGRPAILLILYKSPDANIISTVDRVRDLMPVLRASIPPQIDLEIVTDRTPTIRASVKEVEHALMIAIGLVITVVWAFLRRVRAALVPSVSVPVSLAGTFGVMYLLGYSVDNLSLMALTIATGFVVDDAVVVVENISRHRERGLGAREAAWIGTREIAFTVLTISISLVAVFIPVLFMGGIVGRLFREFAVVLSVAIMVSMFVSLTTTPMMAAHLLGDDKATGRKRQRPPWLLALVMRGYRRSLRWMLRRQPLGWLLFVAAMVATVMMYQMIPKGFFPRQDTGRLMGFVRGEQSVSFEQMQASLDRVIGILRADPAIETVTAFTGGGSRNRAFMFIGLKPLDEGREPAERIINRLRGPLAELPGVRTFLTPVQDIRVGGRESTSDFQYTLVGDDLPTLRQWEPRVVEALKKLPQITDVNSDLDDRSPQVELVIDRDAAARFGVDVRDIDTALYNAFGQRPVGVIYNPLNQYRVVLELDSPWLSGPHGLQQVWLRGRDDRMLPLASVAGQRDGVSALSIGHQGGAVAITTSFALAEGYELSEGTAAVRAALEDLGMPSSLRGSFEGTAGAFGRSMASQPMLIAAAILTIYLVLGILYESFLHPLTILSTLPSAGLGALIALQMTGLPFTVIALIGVFLLIGIVKKNAILVIDFALAAQRAADRAGTRLSPGTAIYRACLRRVRPILMTTAAAALGAVPLAIGSGDGAELRQPLGVAVVGGLMLSQLLTLYSTPVVFLGLERLRTRLLGPRGRGAPARQTVVNPG
ncbi:MAG: efflux RND transporter permease subunit [Burkholderiaceae bacterium]|jgi:multidrug efflux pump|nr:efflux RND transporter permease subunit [Burkholderiaceae bacterium]MEB2318703.1 efflux RND transporter permease subunit [Pseudomonadota bacterium]